MIVASFLTKHLGIDWRHGADHFLELLVDGDVALNSGNWQWVAGTGADGRPNRFLSPIRQAKRFDPGGEYVRRWIPELEGFNRTVVHEPWKSGELAAVGYPPPLIEHSEARARFVSLTKDGS
jgi:deoxyribodipyrimidine photo-lyase